MKYCDKCNVNIIGKRKSCPLCQGTLTGSDDDQKLVFPNISFVYQEFSSQFKIMLFISVIVAAVSIALNILLPKTGAWSIFILGGLGSIWISLLSAINKRNNIPKNIVYQVVIISIIVVIWDILMGWRGWSIDYIIPFICVLAMVSMAIISKVREQHTDDFILYFIIDGLFGIVPIIFMLLNMLNVLYPSLICIVASIISLAAILIFDGERMISEMKRRLHL